VRQYVCTNVLCEGNKSGQQVLAQAIDGVDGKKLKINGKVSTGYKNKVKLKSDGASWG
jgi:hypothetical protein